MTTSLLILIDDRDRVFHSKQRQKYSILKKELQHHIRKLKHDYFISVSQSKNPKQIWRSLRSIGRLRCNASNSSQTFSAEDFNDCFNSNFQVDSSDDLPNSISKPIVPSSSPQLSVHTVSRCLSRLKNKGRGPDGVPWWVYKSFAFSFLQLLPPFSIAVFVMAFLLPL